MFGPRAERNSLWFMRSVKANWESYSISNEWSVRRITMLFWRYLLYNAAAHVGCEWRRTRERGREKRRQHIYLNWIKACERKTMKIHNSLSWEHLTQEKHKHDDFFHFFPRFICSIQLLLSSVWWNSQISLFSATPLAGWNCSSLFPTFFCVVSI